MNTQNMKKVIRNVVNTQQAHGEIIVKGTCTYKGIKQGKFFRYESLEKERQL
jgi:hypothetical protein